MSMAYLLASFFLQDPECFHRGVWGALFGEEIQLRREERGLSIEDAAERAGLSVEKWQDMEAGQVPESWQQLCAVAEGLGEKRVVMASLVIRYAGAWEDGHGLPGQVRQIYS
jgi:DNA-binding XRE family transcriptional regulator